VVSRAGAPPGPAPSTKDQALALPRAGAGVSRGERAANSATTRLSGCYSVVITCPARSCLRGMIRTNSKKVPPVVRRKV
jgi:hypothetical protein